MVFRLGTIPVRVHLSFFLTMLFLGASGNRDPYVIAIWIGVAFFSVLLHELGHALMGRVFGLVPVIELHGMGGTTSWPEGKDVSNGPRVLISLAGPGVGIILGLLVWFGAGAQNPIGYWKEAVEIIVFVNAGWGVMNLLPMLPLDGGNVMAATLNAITGGRGEKPARMVSVVVAVLAALTAFKFHQIFMVVLAAVFALRNVQALGQAGQGAHDEPLRRVLEKAVSDINSGYPHAAIEALLPITVGAKTPQLRAEALRALAYAYEKGGKWGELIAVLQGPLGKMLPDEELLWFEVAADKANRSEEAAQIRAFRAGTKASPVGTEFNVGP